ncbi:unnamed protein product [Boreogadus saida]
MKQKTISELSTETLKSNVSSDVAHPVSRECDPFSPPLTPDHPPGDPGLHPAESPLEPAPPNRKTGVPKLLLFGSHCQNGHWSNQQLVYRHTQCSDETSAKLLHGGCWVIRPADGHPPAACDWARVAIFRLNEWLQAIMTA